MADTRLIAQLARSLGVDPRAALAVASAEGLSGGIGDGGHAFGPWQLNNAGGVITGKFKGWAPERINQWAWSPSGLKFALSGIANVARGMKGPQAIDTIVRKFERPAAPDAEVQRALRAFGGAQGLPTNPRAANVAGSAPQVKYTPLPATPNMRPNARNLDPIIKGLIGGADIFELLANPASMPTSRAGTAPKRAFNAGVPPALPVNSTVPSVKPKGFSFSPVELLHEGVGGATHSTGEHIHAAFTDPKQMLRAISIAQALGLRVGENPYTDPVDPVHAPNSYHKRVFPGLYNGRKLGEAADFTGTRMLELYRRLGGA